MIIYVFVYLKSVQIFGVILFFFLIKKNKYNFTEKEYSILNIPGWSQLDSKKVGVGMSEELFILGTLLLAVSAMLFHKSVSHRLLFLEGVTLSKKGLSSGN